MSTRPILVGFFSIVIACGCTKLNETLEGNLTPAQVSQDSTDALLRGVYASLNLTFTSHLEVFALSGFTTDEAILPTRGSDWDDNGAWRVLHQHRWDANNIHIHDCFNNLSGVVYTATDMLQYKPTIRQQAEARFLRAWAMYWLLDMFNQVPYRDSVESVILPARVRKGTEALKYIIDEIRAVENNLDDGPASKANKFAAKVLLMKCYLNKAVYTNRYHFVFDSADMNKVISLADEIISSGRFSFSERYFDNFSPDNDLKGKNENIFTQMSSSDANYILNMAWLSVLHYNQGGFNGSTTLQNFYDKFEQSDQRRGVAYDCLHCPPNPGRHVNVGFLVGQQYDLFSDLPLGDLIYTPVVKNIEDGLEIKMTGIRPLKYVPDYLNFGYGAHPSNDFVYFRFPDVLLMKAEAILRGGTPTVAGPYGNTALSIVNFIRAHPSRNASSLTSINLDVLLDERGRELWWENWRRQDMIRFGTYLKPFEQKEYDSAEKYILFPIPTDQLSLNHDNLEQNPGY